MLPSVRGRRASPQGVCVKAAHCLDNDGIARCRQLVPVRVFQRPRGGTKAGTGMRHASFN